MKYFDLDCGHGYVKTTATPAVHACQPLKPTLPEPPFTIAQILANFDLMRHAHNIEWCRNIARDVMERGISGCDQCAQGYCCPLEEITKERDRILKIAEAACVKYLGFQLDRDELKSALGDLVSTSPITKENEKAMRQAKIALGWRPHAPKMM